MESELVWHNDGHKISLRLEKNLVVVDSVFCPHSESDNKPCHLTKDGCVVVWFINLYGLECNVGVSPAKPELEIAWTFIGEPEDGIAAGQVWVIPVEDEFFQAWSLIQS